MSMQADEIAGKILSALERQEFQDFYNGQFEKYITGEDDNTPRAVQRAEVLVKIKKIFRL